MYVARAAAAGSPTSTSHHLSPGPGSCAWPWGKHATSFCRWPRLKVLGDKLGFRYVLMGSCVSKGFQSVLALLCLIPRFSSQLLALKTNGDFRSTTRQTQGQCPWIDSLPASQFCKVKYFKLSPYNKPLASTSCIAVFLPCLNPKGYTLLYFFLLRASTTWHGKCSIVYFLTTSSRR